jgi:hypothetical protein
MRIHMKLVQVSLAWCLGVIQDINYMLGLGVNNTELQIPLCWNMYLVIHKCMTALTFENLSCHYFHSYSILNLSIGCINAIYPKDRFLLTYPVYSVSSISSPSTDAVMKALWHTKPASARNSEYIFPLQFNLPHFTAETLNAHFQLLCRPGTFWKYF